MMISRCRWIVPGVALAAAAAAVPAMGAPPQVSWSGAQTLSSTSQASLAAAAALDSRGDGVVFWNACTRLLQNAECPGPYVNQARAFNGGSFERTRIVSRGDVATLDVTARDGRATAYWEPFPRFVARESTSTIGGRWSRPRLSRPPEGGGAEVAYNQRGQALSTYIVTRQGQRSIVARYKRSRTAPWGPPRVVARPAEFPGFPTPVIDRTGRATVVWTTVLNPRSSNDDALRLKASTRRGNGSYVSSFITGPRVGVSDPAVGTNARGDIVVAYRACVPSIYNPMNGECATRQFVRANVRPAGARSFRSARRIGPTNDSSDGVPRAAMNSARRAVVVYWDDNSQLRAARANRLGPFTLETLTASPTGPAAIATTGDGNGVVAWQETDADSGNGFVQASPFGPEGTFGPAATVSDPGAFFASPPSLALSASGRALLIWQGSAGVDGGVVRASTANLG
ncbi:MAG: hypothetical protein ACR2N6_01895 [Miltoncostaeaceae bacterium]